MCVNERTRRDRLKNEHNRNDLKIVSSVKTNEKMESGEDILTEWKKPEYPKWPRKMCIRDRCVCAQSNYSKVPSRTPFHYCHYTTLDH